MKKTLSILLSSAVLQLSIGPSLTGVWAIVVAPAAIKVAPVSGVPGAAGAGVSAVSVSPHGIGTMNLNLGSALYTPAVMTPVSGLAPQADVLGSPASVNRSVAGKKEANPAAAAVLPAVKGALVTMSGRLTRKGKAAPTSEKGKVGLDHVWDKGSLSHKDGKNVAPVPVSEASFSNSPRKSGLKSADGIDKGKRRNRLVIPLALAGVAAIPKAVSAVMAHPVVQQAMAQFTAVVATLPSWLQTSVWVGTGFGAAWVVPKVVRVGAKWVFNQVDWDPLRESYLTNLASSAAWFSAVGFAVYQLGGLSALGLNVGLFASAMALATMDLAQNLASGFQLYRNREHEYNFGDEVTLWDERGKVESINVRFMTIDTRLNKDVEYNRVMMANEKVRSMGLSNHSLGKKAALLGLIPAIFYGAYGPYLAIAGLWYLGSIIKDISAAVEKKAENSGPNEDKAKKLRLGAKILSLAGNVSYIAGLVFILNLFGVPLTGLTTALAVLSAAAGFWTKEVASDLIAGLMVAIWRPFGQGDYIQVGKHPRGVVETITPRTIQIRLEDGSVHYVPLEDLMKEKIRIGLKSAPEAG